MADHPSHRFAGEDERCVYCDARSGGFAAAYECEANPNLEPEDVTPSR